MTDRRQLILEKLTKEQRILVTALSEQLGVSQVTIRKDLDALEQQGVLKREHGYAVLRSTDDIYGRIAYHYEAKKEIAEKAAKLVNDGDTIMIESGSCCALLADTLTQTKKDLTIITNSVFIAEYLREKTNIQLVLLGGIFQPEARINVGPLVQQCAKNFCVDLLFIGTDGYSPKTGFTNKDQMRAQAVSYMAEQAENVIVLTESEKFEKHGTVPLPLTNARLSVVTDDTISDSIRAQLTTAGIQVL